MVLKRLHLQGYKTFANKTEFIFDEGVTAVVGPNGSGKSNIADAIRWVLGEQSFSRLRGKQSTDMIFAGSRQRPRSGMAQVLLTLDNSSGWLPIDYTEVVVGRRIHRSGDSDYLLNGQKVRLRDISELLATSGLAHRTYNIIGQGLVDQALSLKAEERRALFEEAAGISHYKSRRAESLRRLQETQRNLQRVYDILEEIKSRLRSLKRQANRAKNHALIAEDLHVLLLQWYGYQWRFQRALLRDRKSEAVEFEQKWLAGRELLEGKQTEIQALREHAAALQQVIGELIVERDRLRTRVEISNRQVAVLDERQKMVAQQLGRISEELPELMAQSEGAQSELLEATNALQTVQSSVAAQQTQLAQFETTYKRQRAAVEMKQRSVREAERKLQVAQRAVAQGEGQLSQLRERLAEFGEESVDEAALSRSKIAVDEVSAETETLTTTLTQQRSTQQAAQATYRAAVSELKKMRRNVGDYQRTVNKESKALARLETRAEMLDGMRRKAGKIKGGIQVLGRVSNLLTIPDHLTHALEAALRARLSALIVANDDDAWALIAANKNESLTAVARNTAQGGQQSEQPIIGGSGIIGWADGLVTSSSPAVTERLLRTILIVESETAARRVIGRLPAGSLAVTLAGTLVDSDGTLTSRGGGADKGILSREREWREAVAAVTVQQKTVEKAQQTLDDLQETIQKSQNAADEKRRKEQEALRQSTATSREVDERKRKLDRMRQQMRFVKQKHESAARDKARLGQRIEQMTAQTGGQAQQIEALVTQLEAAQTALAAMPVAESRQERSAWEQKITASRTILAGRQAVVDSRRATMQGLAARTSRLDAQLVSLQKQASEEVLSEARRELQAGQAALAAVNEQLLPKQAELVKVRGKMDSAEIEMGRIQKQALSVETDYTRTQVALSKQESRIDGLKERIRADLGLVELAHDSDETTQGLLPLSEIVEQLPTVETLPEGIEDGIQRKRAQLQRIGGINPDAPAEYEATQERFDFLTTQIEDLNKTEKQLRQVIEELDTLTSRAFKETVEKVDVIFGDMFSRLFGGGTAQLVLTAPDDLTVSGVDIIARLPGKRMQGLGLLSGGERALTAAALIFSLLKVSPTPFCVMDEMDAALDEANINRFTDVLRELSLKTQVVVITHNRGTVQAAQTIYGISMNPDSTSQALSIKPEDYVQSEFAE